MIAKIAVEIGTKTVDRLFDYQVPQPLQNKIKIGARVLVSFGYQQVEGFVLDLIDELPTNQELKPIDQLIDENPILNKEMLSLGQYIAQTTLCSLVSAYQVMLPKALKAKHKSTIKIKTQKYIKLNQSPEETRKYLETCRFEKQRYWLEQLLQQEKITISKIDNSLKTLIKNNWILIQEQEIYRYQHHSNQSPKQVTLNNEQIKVVETIKKHENESATYLLYGVTGSGKTEVYINIIKNAIANNKQAILLVPEISLTSQIVGRFTSVFQDDIAILHSGLSDGERYDEYRKIQEEKVHIVIGARSAIFAPFKSLGIIILDEEHSTTYKQENHPRYHARDIAIWRSKYHSCPVILGSATPSLESFARAGNKVYKLLILTQRANQSSLPTVQIIDMKEEVKKGNYLFSATLKAKIQEKLHQNQQIILLLNRRGYSSMFTCSACGYTFKCPRCDISLTYHKTSDTLRCHYCGYALAKITECPKCHSVDIKNYGLGTQKLEEELKKIFPSSRIVRMDLDTTTKKGAHQKIIDDFANHEYDILVGTQMIAKGLDFPLVTLVGVINADMTLNLPDFRSAERTFQLLCQVSGRAGRSSHPGEVVIQTYNEKHYSISLAQSHDYLSFYLEEMKIRKLLKYSPYFFLTLIQITSKDYEKGFEEANKIGKYLRNKLDNTYIILGPTMANMFKINNIYHFQCIIKYQNNELLQKILKEIDERYKLDNKVKIEIDVDPIHI